MTTFVSVIEVAKFTCQNGVEVMPSPDVTSSPSNETYVDEECKTWCYVRENSIEQSTFTHANRYVYLTLTTTALNKHPSVTVAVRLCLIHIFTIYHQGFFHFVRRNSSLNCFHRRQFATPSVSSYCWPRRTQVADKVVSPSCFRSSVPSCPFSLCPLCHSFSPFIYFNEATLKG